MKVLLYVACLSMLAYTALASPCTDICSGTCGFSKQACDFTGLLGALCDVSFGICTSTCGAVCNCVDTCGAECGSERAECRGDGTDLIKAAQCELQFTDCSVLCGNKCAVDTAVSSLGALTGGGGAAKRK